MSEVITQVQAGPVLESTDQIPEMFYLDLRGQRFRLSRSTLLGLPESIVFSLSGGFAYPDNLVPHPNSEQHEHVNHSNESFYQSPRDDEYDLTPVDFNPKFLNYVLDTYHQYADGLDPPTVALQDFPEFRGFVEAHHTMAGENPDSSVPELALEPQILMDPDHVPKILEERPSLIVLKEDIEYYCLAPPRTDDADLKAIKVKAGTLLESQTTIFNELLKSSNIFRPRLSPQQSGASATTETPTADQSQTPEAHLVKMLHLAGIESDSKWHIREREPHKTTVTSLQLSPLRVPEEGDLEAIQAVQKLLLFWKKPARKCWWSDFDFNLDDGQSVKVYVRKVWTLELSILGIKV